MRVLLMAILALVVALTIVATALRIERAKLRAVEMELGACTPALDNLRQEKRSDNAVTDPRIFDIPDRWRLQSD